MIRFNFRRKPKKEDEFASQVVEIIEEKLEDMNIKIPNKIIDANNKEVKLKEELRKELTYEIADFIVANRKVLLRGVV